ncbi:hypothetical protein Tco_1000002 [Tanacetum coccineum]
MASPTKTIKSPLSPSRSPSKIMGSPFSTAMATATWPTLVHWLISCRLQFPCSISDVKISNTFDQKARNVVPDVEEESGSLTEPLWDASTMSYSYPNNGMFVREYTIKLLAASFPNIPATKTSVKQNL